MQLSEELQTNMDHTRGGSLARRYVAGVTGAGAAGIVLRPGRNSDASAASWAFSAGNQHLQPEAGQLPARPDPNRQMRPDAEAPDHLHSPGLHQIQLPIRRERPGPVLATTSLSPVFDLRPQATVIGAGIIIDLHNNCSYTGQKVGGGTVPPAHPASDLSAATGIHA